MRRFETALLLLVLLFLAGCGAIQGAGSSVPQSADPSDASLFEDLAYSSNISREDCYLCGDNMENSIPSQWGQNNIALISLNTFEIKTVEINRYDYNGERLIEAFAGFSSFMEGQSTDGGFSARLMQDHDRGYASGSVYFNNDEVLDISRMADFLCDDCLKDILPLHPDRCFGVGAINLATKDICIFSEDVGGFTLGDFYLDCDLQDKDGDQRRMDLLIFYCPIRYACVLLGKHTVKRDDCFGGGQPASAGLLVLISMYSAILRNSSANLNLTLILPFS